MECGFLQPLRPYCSELADTSIISALQVDSWALGVLLYTLVYGAMPFDGGDHKNLIRQISNGEYKEPTQSSGTGFPLRKAKEFFSEIPGLLIDLKQYCCRCLRNFSPVLNCTWLYASPDARGLIRWMLMVNPERRATVEDIANHWWVNWGWKNSVCDCESQRDMGSPMLARLIDWQSRTEPRVPKGARAEPLPLIRQRPKKSKKENDGGMPHCDEDDNLGLKRPKGILKTRPSEEQRSPSLEDIDLMPATEGAEKEEGSPAGQEDEEPTFTGGPLAKMVPVLPKKGILKNKQQRESGYYSSPERSESSDLLSGSSITPLGASSPPKRAVGRKGILKRNGKYSTYSATPSVAALGETPSGDSGLWRSQSRPSSIVGEDSSVLTNSSFSGAEWPQIGPRPNIRGCASAENILQLANFKGLQAAPALHGGKFGRGTHGSPGDNSSFSLLGDLDDVTQVYQQALDISSNLV